MTTPDIAGLRGLLEKATEAVRSCPINSPLRTFRPDECPKCGATSSEVCRQIARADYAISKAAQETLPDLLSTIEGQAEALRKAEAELSIPTVTLSGMNLNTKNALKHIRQALGGPHD